jgi:hypothetical protein
VILIQQIIIQYSRINLSNVKDNNFIYYIENMRHLIKIEFFLFNFMSNFEGHDLIFLCFDRVNKIETKTFGVA